MSESNLHVFPLKQLFLQICHFRSVCIWENSLSQIEHLQSDDLEDFNWQTLIDKVDICKPFFLYMKLGNVTKGQIISECPYEIIVWTKNELFDRK